MRLRRLPPAVTLLSAVLLSVVAPPAMPAEAVTPAVMITKLYYDSPGTDSRSNASVNAEYVVVKNTTRARLNLYRWTIRDRTNHVYTFAGTFYLNPGASVTVHTGKGTNTAAHRYWGLGYYVWNNDSDSAYVRNPAGTTIDSCVYSSTAVDYKLC